MMKQCFRSYLLIILSLKICLAVHINYIKVPSAVQNNSGQPVILDCNFSYRTDDIDLIVKWLLNDEVVYKWIPPQKPQALGYFKHKIDINYTITDDPRTAYRAMKIINPITSDAGEYKCFISTYSDEDFSTRNMTVFEPEKKLLIYTKTSNSTVVNFICIVDEVYPEPKVILYEGQTQDSLNYVPLLPIEWSTRLLHNGRYTVYVVAVANASTLVAGSLIYCEMRIPGTGYVKRRALLYYPADYHKMNGGGSNIKYLKNKKYFFLYLLNILFCIIFSIN